MPSRSCREKPLRLSGFRECVNTTSVSVRKRVHPPRINFARDRDSRIETGGRMNTPRERPNTGGGQEGTIRDLRYLVVSIEVRRHRLISSDYIKTLYCHGNDIRVGLTPSEMVPATPSNGVDSPHIRPCDAE